MTDRDKAIEILTHNWTKLVNPDCTDKELGQALDLAIKALEERPQGDNKEALFVLNHLFYDCDNMTQKEYDILLEAIKEAENEHGM